MRRTLLLTLILLFLPFSTTCFADTKLDFNKFKDAASKGDLEAVKLFVEAGIDINEVNDLGYTALIMPSGRCHFDVVKYLIGKGIDVNIQARDKYTALTKSIHFCSGMGDKSSEDYYRLVELLLSSGADPNIIGPWGSAIDSAKNEGCTEIVRLLKEYDSIGSAPISEDQKGSIYVKVEHEGILLNIELDKYSVKIRRRKDLSGNYAFGMEDEKTGSGSFWGEPATFYFKNFGYYDVECAGYDKYSKVVFQVKYGNVKHACSSTNITMSTDGSTLNVYCP